MNGRASLLTFKLGNSFASKSLDFGPASAAPAHCSVVDITFTFNSGQII